MAGRANHVRSLRWLLDRHLVARVLGVLAGLGLLGATLSFVVDILVAPWRLLGPDAEESLHLLASVIGLAGSFQLFRGARRARPVVLLGLALNLGATWWFNRRGLGRPEVLTPVVTWALLAVWTAVSRRPPIPEPAPWPADWPWAAAPMAQAAWPAPAPAPQPGTAWPQPGGAWPPQAGAYPPQAGAYPPQAGTYPPQAGTYPPQAGTYPPQTGAWPPPGGASYPPPGTAWPPPGTAWPPPGTAWPPPANTWPAPGTVWQQPSRRGSRRRRTRGGL